MREVPDDAALSWSSLIEAVGPASLLVVIHTRMGDALRLRLAPEDILQEVLLQAWRDRDRIEWQGQQAFRSWLLTLIDHRLADAVDYFNAQKRGGPGVGATAGEHSDRSHADPISEPPITTTPSRLASYREQAELMRQALEEVPEDCREVVRLRLFDEVPARGVAERMGIGESAVRHRFRRGAHVYREALSRMLASRSTRAHQSAPTGKDFRS